MDGNFSIFAGSSGHSSEDPPSVSLCPRMIQLCVMGSLRSSMQISLAGVARWCRALFEPVPVPDGAFAREIRHLKILRQFQRIRRARILAQPAEHAARSVIREKSEHLAPRRVIPLPAHHNQVLRARQRAQIAADAQRLARFRIIVQPRCAPVPLRHHRPLQRILLRHNVLGILRPKGDRQALQKIYLKQSFQEFPHARSFFRRYVFVKQLLYYRNRRQGCWRCKLARTTFRGSSEGLHRSARYTPARAAPSRFAFDFLGAAAAPASATSPPQPPESPAE